jgi:hypothetical protein
MATRQDQSGDDSDLIFTNPNPYGSDAGKVVNPYDILSDKPPTWGETLGHGAAALGSGALYGLTSPADLPGTIYNVGAYGSNKLLGTNADYISTPGQKLQDYFGIPQPVTLPEQILQGAGAQVTGSLMSPFGTSLAAFNPATRMANVLRGAPTNLAIGAGQGFMQGTGWDPASQTGAMTAAALLGHFVPGMMTSASATDLEHAALLRNEKVPINPVDLGPETAEPFYKVGSYIPGSGSEGTALSRFKAWTDAVARRLGGKEATTDENGLFTSDVLQNAATRIDGLYTQTRGAQPLPFDPTTTLYGKLTTIANDALANGTPTSSAQNVADFVNKLKTFAYNKGGQLPSADIINMLRTDSNLSNLTGGDPNMANFYRQIRNAVDDEYGDHLVRTSPNLYDAYNDAKNSYRSLSTVGAAITAGNGKLTPQALAEAAKASPFEGTGPDSLHALGQAGSRFVSVPPDTAPVDQSIIDKQHGSVTMLGKLGLAGLGVSGVGGVTGVIGAAKTAGAGLIGVPYAALQTRLSRAMPFAGPPPTMGEYYANQLLRLPPVGRAISPDPNKPLVPPLLMQQFGGASPTQPGSDGE